LKAFNANIPPRTSEWLKKKFSPVSRFETANDKMFNDFGIKQFFGSQEEYELFKETIYLTEKIEKEADRTEYGDFQTNSGLAKSVTLFLKEKGLEPDIIVEPTCGQGNFIIAALQSFPNAEKVIAVEIYKPYIWETKFNIVDFYIENPRNKKPEIEIHHFNVFDFAFHAIAKQYSNREVLVIGNPPWVTNAKLSTLESGNLPPKSNFKKHAGLDAITGKGNFDIGESVSLMMFDAFQHSTGHFAFLVKIAVIRNVVFDQKQRGYKIAAFQKLNIDSRKEFNVSVGAALLFCKFNSGPEYACREYDFYDSNKCVLEFGWVNDKFVSDTGLYKGTSDIDGMCPVEWRQGIKHDLSSIMELERANGHFVNGLKQEADLEEDLVYAVLKSSDLKEPVIAQTRKYTIITQKKIGQDTSFIREKFPKTFAYLHANKPLFDLRKSGIYDNKPDFSIFGIGDYSFSPFKIAISGLYKTFSFSLVLPIANKPVMLDDTCYLLGFGNLEFAAYTLILLNSDKTRAFLQSITFLDAKRIFTKGILMRIDLYKLATLFSETALRQEIHSLNEKYDLQISPGKWGEYLESLKPGPVTRQMDLFA